MRQFEGPRIAPLLRRCAAQVASVLAIGVMLGACVLSPQPDPPGGPGDDAAADRDVRDAADAAADVDGAGPDVGVDAAPDWSGEGDADVDAPADDDGDHDAVGDDGGDGYAGPTLTVTYADPCPCVPPPCCPQTTFRFEPGSEAAWYLMCGDAVACDPPPMGWERFEGGTWVRVVSPGLDPGAGFSCAPEVWIDPWINSVPEPPSGTVRAVGLFDSECGPDPLACTTRCETPFEVVSNEIVVP